LLFEKKKGKKREILRRLQNDDVGFLKQSLKTLEIILNLNILLSIEYGGDTGSTANGEQREACRRRSLRKKPKQNNSRTRNRSRCL